MSRRRRGCGCLPSLLGLVLVVGVVLAVVNGADYVLFAPWAYGLLGQPTLTGDWEGTMRTHSGVRYAVYVHLDRDRSRRGDPINTRGHANIDGHISWCTRSIPNTTSTVFGFANRSASNVVFEVNERSNPPTGLYPIHVHGSWHRTTLALHVLFYLYQKHGYIYSSGIRDDVEPVSLTLHKRGYSTYQAACRHI